ncbi:nicotinamide-nucleotide amidase [Mycetocola sp. CAN_C7]|uniref:CinA family protein n=1 Tax=Mycetocola sp. CAN_C7 TaxID=2787724 RepID=UPI0018CA423F
MPSSNPSETQAIALAESIAAAADGSFLRIAVAESLTRGAIAFRLGGAPNASEWFSGGVVTNTTDAKQRILELGTSPVVSARAAEQMAAGVARLFGANLTVSVTGIQGPDRQDGHDVGTVFIGVHSPHGELHVAERALGGSPDEIVDSAVVAALRLLESRVHALVSSSNR